MLLFVFSCSSGPKRETLAKKIPEKIKSKEDIILEKASSLNPSDRLETVKMICMERKDSFAKRLFDFLYEKDEKVRKQAMACIKKHPKTFESFYIDIIKNNKKPVESSLKILGVAGFSLKTSIVSAVYLLKIKRLQKEIVSTLIKAISLHGLTDKQKSLLPLAKFDQNDADMNDMFRELIVAAKSIETLDRDDFINLLTIYKSVDPEDKNSNYLVLLFTSFFTDDFRDNNQDMFYQITQAMFANIDKYENSKDVVDIFKFYFKYRTTDRLTAPPVLISYIKKIISEGYITGLDQLFKLLIDYSISLKNQTGLILDLTAKFKEEQSIPMLQVLLRSWENTPYYQVEDKNRIYKGDFGRLAYHVLSILEKSSSVKNKTALLWAFTKIEKSVDFLWPYLIKNINNPEISEAIKHFLINRKYISDNMVRTIYALITKFYFKEGTIAFICKNRTVAYRTAYDAFKLRNSTAFYNAVKILKELRMLNRTVIEAILNNYVSGPKDEKLASDLSYWVNLAHFTVNSMMKFAKNADAKKLIFLYRLFYWHPDKKHLRDVLLKKNNMEINIALTQIFEINSMSKVELFKIFIELVGKGNAEYRLFHYSVLMKYYYNSNLFISKNIFYRIPAFIGDRFPELWSKIDSRDFIFSENELKKVEIKPGSVLLGDLILKSLTDKDENIRAIGVYFYNSHNFKTSEKWQKIYKALLKNEKSPLVLRFLKP